MSEKGNRSFNEQILDEIWDEISLLEGSELDELLREIGLEPDELLQQYVKSAEGAKTALRRARFEDAKLHVRDAKHPNISNVVSLGIARKQQILVAIKDRMSQSNDMTMAARNQKIDAEEDLDSFLEACVRLGVIDEDGNLKV